MDNFDMELTRRQAKNYQKATKKKKGKIIYDHLRLTGVSKNLASKRFRSAIKNIYPRVLKKGKRKKAGKKKMYTKIHGQLIKKMWDLSGEICGERLHPVLDEYIIQLKQNDLLKMYSQKDIKVTTNISQATLKRIIAEFPKTSKVTKAKGNNQLHKQIPIDAHFGQNTDKPGFVEVDYVEHNGDTSSGIFAITGSYLDIFSGWIARAAELGKTYESVEKIHYSVLLKIYHLIKEFHPDNAKTILKLLLKRKLDPDNQHDFLISRSRPYHKEDNGHVEQKNDDKVRELVGYHRYDEKIQVILLNDLYNIEDVTSNFFVPSQKLIEKTVDEKGRVLSRKHDHAKTAYQRLMESEDIKKTVKKKLTKMYKGFNLVNLRKESERIQDKLFKTVISRK